MLEMAEIERRRDALRFPIEELAKAAGCNPNTAGPALKGKTSPRHDTVVSMTRALIAEELRLRDYLLALHPIQTHSSGEAA